MSFSNASLTIVFEYCEIFKPGSAVWLPCQNANISGSWLRVCPNKRISKFLGRTMFWLSSCIGKVSIIISIPISFNCFLISLAADSSSGI